MFPRLAIAAGLPLPPITVQLFQARNEPLPKADATTKSLCCGRFGSDFRAEELSIMQAIMATYHDGVFTPDRKSVV